MTVHISRDYLPSGTFTINKAFSPFIYGLSLFLYRVLGWNIVGKYGWDLDSAPVSYNITGITPGISPIVTTPIPHGLTTGQSISLSNDANWNGSYIVTVTSPTTFILNGAIGGIAGGSGIALISGMLYASGLIADGYGTGINYGSGVEKQLNIPISKRKVVAGDVGRMLVLKSTLFPTKNSGCFKISAINVGTATTIAAGSNGQSLPQSTINVVSTTGFAASGTIFVTTSTGSYAVTYTGTTGTSFTGCSGGTGTMSTGGQVCTLNRYTIDYRSTENPPAEADNTIDWWLQENESVVSSYMPSFLGSSAYNISNASNTSPIVITAGGHQFTTGQKVEIFGVNGNSAANGIWTVTALTTTTFSLDGSTGNGAYTSGGTARYAGYMGDGTYRNAKIIFQSPHPTGYQVRLCVEPTGVNLPLVSISTGYGGDGYGDFQVGGLHNHLPIFFDISPNINTTYNNLTIGGGTLNTTNRMTMVAEDSGQYVMVYARTTGATANGILMFGVPDNEPIPTPNDGYNRLFCYGAARNDDFGGIILKVGTSNNVGMSLQNRFPHISALSSWANLDGTSATSPLLSANAGDSPFTSSTELLPIEIWSGVTTDIGLTGSIVPPFAFNQYLMGTAPLLRNGRANFGNFTLTTEETTSRTVTNATNASPIQITTSVANALVTGQTVTVSGVTGNTAANGTWTITVINSTNFTLDNSTGNGAYVSGGTVNGCPRWIHLQNGVYLKWDGPGGLSA